MERKAHGSGGHSTVALAIAAAALMRLTALRLFWTSELEGASMLFRGSRDVLDTYMLALSLCLIRGRARSSAEDILGTPPNGGASARSAPHIDCNNRIAYWTARSVKPFMKARSHRPVAVVPEPVPPAEPDARVVGVASGKYRISE
jgi:hypothetical protein